MSKPRLPALPRVSTGNTALDNWIQSVTEILQVREGARGDRLERVVTLRDLEDLGLDTVKWSSGGNANLTSGLLVQQSNGEYAVVSVEAFSGALRDTTIFRDLQLAIDRGGVDSGLPDEIKSILEADLAAEAAARGAAISRVERLIQTSTQSLASEVKTLTASVSGAVAAVRQTAFATASESSATAGLVDQLIVNLDGTGSATATQSLTVIADRTTGLRAQKVLKMTAGNTVAGIGLLASEDPGGTSTSAFLVEAGQFGVMAAINFTNDGTTTPSATAIGQIWYNTTTKVYKRATATGTANWVTYTPQSIFTVDTTTGEVYINGALKVTGPNTVLSGSASRSVSLTTSKGGFAYNSAGVLADTTTSTLTATAVNTSGTVYYEFIVGGTTVQHTTTNTYTYTAPGTYPTAPVTMQVNIREGATGNPVLASDMLTTVFGRDGSKVVQVYLSNPSVTLSTTSGGAVTYTGSGTSVMVAEGITLLTEDNVAPYANSTFRVTSVAGTGITPGSISSGSGTTTLTYGVHSNMTTANATVVFTVVAKNSEGTEQTFTITQSLSKAIGGTNGSTGTRGSVSVNITGPFTAAAAAAAVVALTGTNPVVGDICYYTGSPGGAQQCTAAGSPGTWGAVAAFIDGSLVASGTISAGVKLDTTGWVSATGDTANGSIVAFSNARTAGSFVNSTTATASIAPVGVYGQANTAGVNVAVGVLGYSANGIGIFGNGFTAGNFVGKMGVTGNTDITGTLAVSGAITASGNITAYQTSDVRYKENIVPIPDPIDKLKAIRGVSYDWKNAYLDDNGPEDSYFNRKHEVGVIAQEVLAVLPEVVGKRPNGTLAVKYDRLTALLIEAVKELVARVEELERR